MSDRYVVVAANAVGAPLYLEASGEWTQRREHAELFVTRASASFAARRAEDAHGLFRGAARPLASDPTEPGVQP